MTLRITFALAGAMALSALGQTSQTVDVKKGTVVYVSGQDLVVKMEDGSLRNAVVPNDFKFHVNGKDVGIEDLKPGTELTQTITTTTHDTNVTSVRNVDVTVKDVKPPYVVVQSPDGSTRQVKVPDGAKIDINGSEKTVFDLKPGMKLKGTVVTTTPQVVVSAERKITGNAPQTPNFEGVLLIEESDK